MPSCLHLHNWTHPQTPPGPKTLKINEKRERKKILYLPYEENFYGQRHLEIGSVAWQLWKS